MAGKPDYTDYLNSLRESITVLYQQKENAVGPDLVNFAVYLLESVVAGVEERDGIQ